MGVCSRVRLLPFLLLATAGCGDDDGGAFPDAPPRPDASIDGGGDRPDVEFPAMLALGPGDCGGAASVTFDAHNLGAADLEFEITSSSGLVSVTPSTGTIAAGTSTTFTVTADVPGDASPGTPITADLTVTSPALDAPASIAVTAEPRGAVIGVTPAAANFGDVQLGMTGTQTIAVTNTGNAAASVAIAAPTSPEFAAAFAAGELAAGGERAATVTYTPTGIGEDTATAAITVTGVTCGTPPASLPMSASGIPVGGVAVTGNLAFGAQACGAAAGSSTVTITNYGASAATWTAQFLADPDTAYYALSATSGTVAAGGTATVTVTRRAIALPATPRAYDVTLRVTTMGVATVNHTLPVTQLLRGPFLAASPTAFDFGFVPAGQSLAHPIAITNSGNVSAAATFTEAGAAQLTVPQAGATIATGGSASLTAVYAASPPAITSGTVTVTAPNACSGAVVIPIAMGEGAWGPLPDDTIEASCAGFSTTDSIEVVNLGNQPLTIRRCFDLSGVVVASFGNLPLTLGAGATGSIDYTWLPPQPLRSGTTVATIRCDTNETFYATRQLELTRTLTGADLAIAQLDGPFDFTCGQGDESLRLEITNSGNRPADVVPDWDLVEPLSFQGDATQLAPGASVELAVEYDADRGSSSWCEAEPGDFTGSAGVDLGAAGAVCSVTGSETYPVRLLQRGAP